MKNAYLKIISAVHSIVVLSKSLIYVKLSLFMSKQCFYKDFSYFNILQRAKTILLPKYQQITFLQF